MVECAKPSRDRKKDETRRVDLEKRQYLLVFLVLIRSLPFICIDAGRAQNVPILTILTEEETVTLVLVHRRN